MYEIGLPVQPVQRELQNLLDLDIVEKEIFEAIYGILSNNDLRVSLISQGLKRVEIFTWEKTVEQTFKIYEEIFASVHSSENLRPLHS